MSETEKDFDARLARKLRDTGFVVYEKVEGRNPAVWHGNREICMDLYIVIPTTLRARDGIRSIGFECKKENLGLGEGGVEPFFQVQGYLHAFDWHCGDKILPGGKPNTEVVWLTKPDIVLLASPDSVSTDLGHVQDDPFATIERMLWKVGGGLLRKKGGLIGFQTNISGLLAWTTLFEVKQ